MTELEIAIRKAAEADFGVANWSHLFHFRPSPKDDMVILALVLADEWRMENMIFDNHLCANDIGQDTLFLFAYYSVQSYFLNVTKLRVAASERYGVWPRGYRDE